MLDSYAFLKRVASSSQVKRKYTYTRWIDGRTDGHPRVTLDIIAREKLFLSKTTRRKTRAILNFEILAEKRLSSRERHEKKVEKRFGAFGSTATRRLVKDQQ